MTELSVRHYQATNREAILTIAADTAFFGEPVEAFLDDRKLYNDAFARYYLEYEAPFVWVADSPGEVIGFLLGCADTARQSRLWRKYIVTRVLVNALAGRYRLGRRTGRFAWGMLVGASRGEEPWVDLRQYPAHLQIDVRQGYRGRGVGKSLINAYMEQLRQLDVDGVHLGTTSHNEAACQLYEKVGFQLLDQRLNRFWTQMLGMPVYNRSYGMKFKNHKGHKGH